ncbi:thioesterase [Aeromicrobium sp. 636]|uniref:Thioesterase family protein n=1 Tax=Aeromicrobium senzhongii TaxID=2663859 RepID=A0A8I0K2K2_9ACTN|nr:MULTISPECIES: thioesterase family protein [Aeromicrobium]MBC9226494.1 thioesterase family protein [Aeromicrobium senzhongii]MCQ3998598.1 thioesterase [Aeromicrobium sp. 636]
MTSPTLEQIHRVPAVLTRQVGDEDIDLNHHMNAAIVFARQVEGIREAFSRAGVTENYVNTRAMGTFVVEHHIRYLKELRHGDAYSVRVRFLERTEKAVHVVSCLVSEAAAAVANIVEGVVVHVDQRTRRPTAFPSDIAAELDAQINAGDRSGWAHQPHLIMRGSTRA